MAELAGRGIRVRQLLDFYARLGEDVMTHFDPAKSTTHDVVRQAIIPLSMELRDLRTFRVTLHEVFGVDGGPCKITVGGGVPKSPKPWSSGDGMLAPAQSLRLDRFRFRTGSVETQLNQSQRYLPPTPATLS